MKNKFVFIGVGYNSGSILRDKSHFFLILIHFRPFAHKKSFRALTRHFNSPSGLQPWIAKNINNFINKWKTVITCFIFNCDMDLLPNNL